MPYSEEFEAKRDIMVSKITASPFFRGNLSSLKTH